jgi:hypothetical protein
MKFLQILIVQNNYQFSFKDKSFLKLKLNKKFPSCEQYMFFLILQIF